MDFLSRAQFSRPHAVIPIVWEQPLDVTDVSVAELLRTGEPLYWPGEQAAPEDQRNFWSSLLERTTTVTLITDAILSMTLFCNNNFDGEDFCD